MLRDIITSPPWLGCVTRVWLPQVWSRCEGRDRTGRVNISHCLCLAPEAEFGMLSTARLFIH